jgi:hypothetical protein
MARIIEIGGERYRVVESLGYNPDVGQRVYKVQGEDGVERTAVGYRRAYRLWTARDRVVPTTKPIGLVGQ